VQAQAGGLLHGRTADKTAGVVSRVPNVAVIIIPPSRAVSEPSMFGRGPADPWA